LFNPLARATFFVHAAPAPDILTLSLHDALPISRMTVQRPHAGLKATIWLGFAAGFIGMAHRVGFGVLYPGMVADQDWSVGEVTGAFSVAMLIYSPGALLAGMLVDRLGVRSTMLLGTSLLSVGLAG